MASIQNNYSEYVSFKGKKGTRNQLLDYEQREYPEGFGDDLEKDITFNFVEPMEMNIKDDN